MITQLSFGTKANEVFEHTYLWLKSVASISACSLLIGFAKYF